jgi:hypothetical protein
MSNMPGAARPRRIIDTGEQEEEAHEAGRADARAGAQRA